MNDGILVRAHAAATPQPPSDEQRAVSELLERQLAGIASREDTADRLVAGRHWRRQTRATTKRRERRFVRDGHELVVLLDGDGECERGLWRLGERAIPFAPELAELLLRRWNDFG